jgi:3'(2'), 5'-bisphosphate nucleotidase
MIEEAHGVVIAPILEAARAAGEKILEIYGRDFAVEYKGDDSPLTEADEASNAVIMEFLRTAHAGTPVISEENREIPYGERREWGRFWLVDPLDGTKEFIKKNGEFTVNIALIEDGRPVVGVVYRPVTATMYFGAEGKGAWRSLRDKAPEEIAGGPHYLSLAAVKVVGSR